MNGARYIYYNKFQLLVFYQFLYQFLIKCFMYVTNLIILNLVVVFLWNNVRHRGHDNTSQEMGNIFFTS